MMIDNKNWIFSFLIGLIFLTGCSPGGDQTGQTPPTTEDQFTATPLLKTNTPANQLAFSITPSYQPEASTPESTEVPAVKTEVSNPQAKVLSVDVKGEPGAYSFSVQISSPDEGCSQYADWWEVVSLEGELIYRRVLLHSHVSEQPFTRSGGPVAIDPQTEVLVRAHMNTSGYGNQAMKGSLENGFTPVELSPDFAQELSEQSPLPEDCAF
jgi:hypothetical protein